MSETLKDPGVTRFDPVVAALADQGWGVFPGFVDAAAITDMERESLTLWRAGGFRTAGIGNGACFQRRPEIRNDQVLWLEPPLLSPALQLWMDNLEALRAAINQALFLGLFDFEGHLAVYPPGAFYRKHLDQFKGIGLRTVTTILYLNQRWPADAGGQLRLYLEPNDDSRFVEVAPEGGTLVTFLSGTFVHEVLPANRPRVSLTGWFKRRP